jgi:hypothetical protein
VTSPLQRRPTWWEDEGRRIAGQLRDVSAVVVAGMDPGHAAQVALGIASAECGRRHVALGDLTGRADPLYAVAGGEDAFGLSDCLRQDLSLDDIARPAPDRGWLFILPAGSPPVACEEILAHERWPRLVNGFAKAGALLVLVAPLDAPGLATLVAATGGAVLVDDAGPRRAQLRVLASVAAPEQPRGAVRASPGRGARLAVRAALAVLAVIAVGVWFGRQSVGATFRAMAGWRGARPTAGTARPPSPPAPPAQAPGRAERPAAAPADTVRLADPVNPADTSIVAPFAVEVMAANTLAGANSYLSDHGGRTSLNGATVSPVPVGGSTNVWYTVVAGASHDRAGADSLLAALRRDGLVRREEGRVVKVPYALVLADHVERTSVPALRESWRRRGFDPYVLVQADGSGRLLAGAFETPAQAAPLAATLRAAGVEPVVAFRTGRTY